VIEMESETLGIGLVSKKDLEKTSEFINEIFDIEKTPESLEWEFFHNPHSKKIPSLPFVAKDSKGDVVALYCSQPTEIVAKKDNLVGLCGCYRSVKEEFRGEGISTKLFNESEKEISRLLGKSPILYAFAEKYVFDINRKGFIIFECNLLLRLKKIFKPITPLGVIASGNYNPIFMLMRKKDLEKNGRRLVEFPNMRGFLEKNKKLPSNKSFSGITVNLERKTMEWQFSENKAENYKIFGLSKKGKLTAYAIATKNGRKLVLHHFDAIGCKELSILLAMLEKEVRKRGFVFIEFEGLPSVFFDHAFVENGYSFEDSEEYLHAVIGEGIRTKFPEGFFENEHNWLITRAANLSE